MTELQYLMLSVCFGAVVGWIVGSLVSIARSALGEIKEKCRKRKEAKEAANKEE